MTTEDKLEQEREFLLQTTANNILRDLELELDAQPNTLSGNHTYRQVVIDYLRDFLKGVRMNRRGQEDFTVTN